jgi:hypothetical protein
MPSTDSSIGTIPVSLNKIKDEMDMKAQSPSHENRVLAIDKELPRDLEKRQSTSSGTISSISQNGEEGGDINVISWDGEDDPQNPINWTSRKKWTNVGIISSITFVT